MIFLGKNSKAQKTRAENDKIPQTKKFLHSTGKNQQ
jgi:hypothetical protein